MTIIARPKTMTSKLPKLRRGLTPFGKNAPLRSKGRTKTAGEPRSAYKMTTPNKPIFVGVRNRSKPQNSLWSISQRAFRVLTSGRLLKKYPNSHVRSWFVRASRSGRVDYAALQTIFEQIFSSTTRTWKDTQVLLRGHENLMRNPVAAIADAFQRHVDEKPPRVDRPAEVILGYDDLMKQGAADASWKQMVRYLEEGGPITHPKSYAVPGQFSVAKAISRSIEFDTLNRLKEHRLIQLFIEWGEAVVFEPTSLILDFLEEVAIPLPFRQTALEGTGLEYSRTSGTLVDGDGTNVTLEASSDQFAQIVANIIRGIGNPRVADGEVQKNIAEQLTILLTSHLFGRFEHFKEHVTEILENVDDIQRQSHTLNAPFESEAWLQTLLEKVYTSAREIALMGLPDYVLSREIVDSVRSLLLAPLPNRSEVVAKLTEWNVEIPEDVNLSQFIQTYLTRTDVEIPRLFRTGKKRRAQELSAQRKYLKGVDLTTRNAIEKTTSWRELLTASAAVVKGLPIAATQLLETWKTLRTQLTSFGKYFSTQVFEDERIGIHLLPVKGLSAAVAIDTGSDCGEGMATARAVIDQYMTFIITDAGHTKPWGYHGLYSVLAASSLWFMTDALNPSTQLNIEGGQFINGVQSHLRAIRQAAQARSVSILGFLASASKDLFSNREPISDAHPEGLAARLPSPIDTIPATLNTMWEIVQLAVQASGASSPPFYKMIVRRIQSGGAIKDLTKELHRFHNAITPPEEDLTGYTQKMRATVAEERALFEQKTNELYKHLRPLYDLDRASTPEEMESAFKWLTERATQEQLSNDDWWQLENIHTLFRLSKIRDAVEDLRDERLDPDIIYNAQGAITKFQYSIPDGFDVDGDYTLRQSDPAEAVYFIEPE